MISRPAPPATQRPLRRAIHLALLGLAAATALPASAQSTAGSPSATEQTATRQFQIGPGNLSDVLARFAGQAGVALSFDAARLRGLQSQGLHGSFSVGQGFSRLLAGTGFEASHQGAGNYLLRERPPGEATLAPVTVTASSMQSATTEGSGNYASGAVTIGKGTQGVRDIPQSVSVVTQQRIKDQNMSTVADAMRQTTGMTVVSYGTGTSGISARGFALDSIQIDGIAVQTGQGMWGTAAFDLAMYDRLEVLRGPAGVLQGSGEPGGAVNLVRKRAQAKRSISFTAQAGSWDRYRTQVDATGALTEDGRLRGRLVATYDDEKSFIDTVYSRKPLFYGTIEYDIDAATTLSAGITRQRMTSRPDVGLPTYADDIAWLPRSTYLGSDWDRKTEETTNHFVEAEHRFDDGGEARIRISRMERDYSLLTSAFGDSYIDPSTGDIQRRLLASEGSTRDTGIDAWVSKPFEALGREHRFTVGANARTYDHSFSYLYIDRLPQNVFDPVRDLPKPSYTMPAPSSAYKNTQYGIHGQLQLRLTDATQLVVGGRLANWKTENKVNPAASYRVRNEFTPNLGMIHDLSAAYSVYASYAGIFQPQNGQSISGALDPRTGTQIEVGIKGELAGGRTTLHAALFRIDDENRAMSDPDNPGFSINAGKVRSEGFEAEIAGQVTRRWNLMAGYAYTKARYLKADGALRGTDFSSRTLRHSMKLWNTWQISGDATRGWTLGGGLEYSSGVYAENSGVKWKQGAYTIASASASYRFDEDWSLALNVENLFDKKYYTRMDGWFRQSYYGNPRNFMLTLRGSF